MSRRRCEAWTTASNYNAPHLCVKDGKVTVESVLGTKRKLCPLHKLVLVRDPRLLKFSKE